VRVSGARALVAPDSESVIGRGHDAIEKKLQDCGIKWTVLRPGYFMQNTLAQSALVKNDSKLVQPFPADFPLAFIDVRDTGAVAARILVDPAPHAGKTYEFTGAATNYGEFAETFSQALGRKITYVAITPEQNEQAMKARGMPDWLIAHVRTITGIALAGGLSTAKTAPIQNLVKRVPLTTKQFVEDHKAAFA